MRIIGPPSVNRDTVVDNTWALTPAPEPFFMTDVFLECWNEAVAYGLDPVGVVAQAGHETGWGRFGRAIDARWCNTAGIKIRYLGGSGMPSGEEPLAHTLFPSWTIGARAQVQHLRAYAGWPVPGSELVDPRYQLVIGKHWCESWEDLGGHWAPSLAYGKDVVAVARRLGYPH